MRSVRLSDLEHLAKAVTRTSRALLDDDKLRKAVLRSSPVAVFNLRGSHGDAWSVPIIDVRTLHRDVMAARGGVEEKLMIIDRGEASLREAVSAHDTPPVATVAVRESAESAAHEIYRRQLESILRTKGAVLSGDISRVEKFVSELLDLPDQDKATAAREHGAVLSGIVEQLAKSDFEVALELAAHPLLPHVQPYAVAQVAEALPIEKAVRIMSAVEKLHAKDKYYIGPLTFATRVARRLHAAAFDRKIVHDLINRFPCDPAAVDNYACRLMSEWLSAVVGGLPCPTAKAEALLATIKERALVPSLATLKLANLHCLSSLDREWILHCLKTPLGPEDERQWHLRESCLRFVSQNPKRALIDQGLLDLYAELFEKEYFPEDDRSFPGYVEACGEDHCANSSRCVRLDLARNVSTSLKDQLLQLAPQCVFWKALLTRPECVSVGPSGDDDASHPIVISLPPTHDSMLADYSKVQFPDIIYEDSDVVAINKPSGIATTRHGLGCVLSDAQESCHDIASLMLKSQKYGDRLSKVFRGGVVHRLDTDTSGALLLALNESSSMSLRHQMGSSGEFFSSFPKTYHAICVVLARDLSSVPISGTIKDGEQARVRTKYRILRFFREPRMVFVECRIQQGKKHQIRKHLASIGLPVVQDLFHGGAACCTALIDRIALHASAITFIHPKKMTPLQINAGLPLDMKDALRLLSAAKV